MVGGTVSFTDGTAEKGKDYFGADTSITFANNQTEVTLEVILKDDSVGEATETLNATLSSPTGGATLGEQASTSIEIFDTDADFTTTAAKITMTADQVIQSDVIDLNQPSILDSSTTYIELINEIPLLATSKLTLVQPSTGLVEIEFGDDKFYLRPNRISRNVLGLPVGVRTSGSNSYRFVTSSGYVIDMHPAVATISSLQASLSSLAMPELVITDQGNITIQKDQGVPKIEENEKGELVLSDSFYERWHISPLALVLNSPYTTTGVYQLAHPTLEGQVIVGLYFQEGSDYKVQYLSPAPAIDAELEVSLRQRVGVTGVTFGEYGIVNFSTVSPGFGGIDGATKFSLLSDYTLTKVRDFVLDDQGFYDYIDVNDDGIRDFRMIYSNGDAQIFLTVSAE